MKGMILYLAVMAGGGVAGAVGVGAYNVFVVGVEAEAGGTTAEEGDTGGEMAADDPRIPAEGAAEQLAEPETDTPPGEPADASVEVRAADDPDPAEEPGEEAVATADPPQADVAEVESAPIDPEELARIQANYARLARIFMAMKPEEAAPVLAQLDDSQLEGILLAMQGRNAAPILAEMDPARVASISRKVLGGNE